MSASNYNRKDMDRYGLSWLYKQDEISQHVTIIARIWIGMGYAGYISRMRYIPGFGEEDRLDPC